MVALPLNLKGEEKNFWYLITDIKRSDEDKNIIERGDRNFTYDSGV